MGIFLLSIIEWDKSTKYEIQHDVQVQGFHNQSIIQYPV